MHNQVTRLQGVFSLRAQTRSFGLSFMAENIKVPTTVLDFPTQEEFVSELKKSKYTHVGISFTVPNIDKAKRMCELVRQHSPGTIIIAGGHGARIKDIKEILGCDEVCVGEGTAWLRNYFGEKLDTPLKHPAMAADYSRYILGIPAPHNKAILIPGVGCNNRCNFCATSHFFEAYRPFFGTAKELFATMIEIADKMKTDEFFVLDENFLDDKTRINELLTLMEKHDRWFRLDIFSSLRAISQYDPQTLMRLGIQFVWIGIESQKGLFEKSQGIDAASIIDGLRKYGISVPASSILFLDHHDKESISRDIDYVISLKPDFIQFMELAPFPGTTLFQDLDAQGRILHEIPMQEWHGQDLIWFRHGNFNREETKAILDEAFSRDYLTLGPSLLRIVETKLHALSQKPASLDRLMQKRYEDLRKTTLEMRPLLGSMAAMAATPQIKERTLGLQKKFSELFGPPGLLDRAAQAAVHLLSRLESRRGKRTSNPWQPKTYRKEHI